VTHTGPSSASARRPGGVLTLLTDRDCRRMATLAASGFASFFLTLSALPAWLASHGFSAAGAGASTTAMLAATIVSQPVAPLLLSRMRNTTATVVLGLALLAAPASLLLVTGPGPIVYAVNAMRGIGFGVFTVAVTVMVAEISPPGRQGTVAALYGLSASLPQIVLLPAGVVLLQADGFWLVATLAAAPTFALLLALGRSQAAPARPAPTSALGGPPRPHACGSATSRPNPLMANVAVRARPPLAPALPPALVLCAGTIVSGAIVTFMPIVRPRGYLAGAALLLYGLAAAVARWLAGIAADRHRTARWLPGGLTMGGAGLLALAGGLSGGLAALTLAGCALAGASLGIVQSLTLLSALGRVGNRRRAAASALWNVAFDTGTAVGAALIGLMYGSVLGVWGSLGLLAAMLTAALPAALASAGGIDASVR
jgi:MFS family permease